ncbi:Competence protein [Tenacibaculum sp. 190524A02b]|uniref:ComEC/Rec2 family competence protein n=1 Tax=Tenacibaculum vairaonense TaxID=3137860 RepID=UPI0032B10AE2
MKNLLKYPPFYFLISLIIGIFLQFYYQVWKCDFVYVISIQIIFLILLLITKNFQNGNAGFVSNLLFFVNLGSVITYIQNPQNHDNYFDNFSKNKREVVLKINKKLNSNKYSNNYKAEVVKVDGKKTKGFLLLSVYKKVLKDEFEVDDNVVVFHPDINGLKRINNLGQFDYRSFLAKKYIYHTLYLNKDEFKVLNSDKRTLFGLASLVRSSVKTSLENQGFSNEVLAIMSALFLGDKNDINKQLLEQYKNAGAIHLLAISGLHIGVLLLLFSLVLKPLLFFKYGRIYKGVLLVLMLWSFAFIAGLSASVVRAVTMFTFITIGESFKSRKVTEHVLISSMFFLLLIKPMFVFSVGFQLSYLAVFGIVWIQPKIYQVFSSRILVIDKLWKLITVSIAAQVAVLPLSLYYFHQFPSLFLLSSLFIIPFLEVILGLGLVVILLSIFNASPSFLIDSYSFIITKMNAIIEKIASQDQFLITGISMSLLKTILWYLLLIMLFQLFKKRVFKNVIWVLLIMMLIQGQYILEKYIRDQKQELIIFNKRKETIIGVRKAHQITIFHSLDSLKIRKEKGINGYARKEDIKIEIKNKLPLFYVMKGERFVVIDKSGVYDEKFLNRNNPIILLRNSPKINLSRLLNITKPKLIIADGSSYYSYVERWRKTCEKEKVPFWHTAQNGTFKY